MFSCPNCDKVFERKYNLKRHLNTINCSRDIISNLIFDRLKKLEEKIDQQFNKFEERFQKIEKQIKVVRVEKTIEHTNIHFFGNETIDHISHDQFKKILMKTSTCLQNLYKIILENEKNHNVYINNLCKSSLWLKTKNGWEKKHKKNVFANICDNMYILIEDFMENDPFDKNHIIQRIKTFLEEQEDKSKYIQNILEGPIRSKIKNTYVSDVSR